MGLDDLERWAADARAREAAEARVRERWLRTQAEEGARLVQVLTGLAERRAAVVVTTIAGRQVAGRLSTIGADFVGVESSPGGVRTLVALGAVAWVRAVPGDRRRPEPEPGPDPSGFDDDEASSAASPRASLADVLAQAVAHRPRVAVQAGGAPVTGELRAVGVDVMALQMAGELPGLAYVPLPSVYEISFLDSG